jgi:cell shape-determining protein MreC
MNKRTNVITGFMSFLFLAVFIYVLSQTFGTSSIHNISGVVFGPIQGGIYHLVSRVEASDESENALLDKRIKLIDLKELEKENRALRDQFAVTYPSPKNLIPAPVVGARSFIPGKSLPQTITLHVGKKNNVKVGHAVVYKDNLIGKITKTFDYYSEVSLISKPNMVFTVVTQNTDALGTVNGGTGDNLVISNVHVSSKLEKKDIVLTKGDMQPDGTGYPPNLIIGEISSISKQASGLFQSAEIKRFVDATKLPMVFVVLR